MMRLGVLLLLTLHSLRAQNAPDGKVFPLLFVPGIAGSSLMARYVNCTIPSCVGQGPPLDSDWFRLWIKLTNFRPPRGHQQCWFNTMTLQYKPPSVASSLLSRKGSTGIWSSSPGVEVTVDQGLKGVAYLDYIDGYGLPPTKYFAEMIGAFQGPHTEPHSMRAFPYDWRLPAWQYDWLAFKQMVEELHRDNGKPVVLLVHSMGMLAVNYLLHRAADEDWKKEHIRAIISINAASGGSMKIVRSLLSGYSPTESSWLNYFKIPQLLSNSDLRALSNTMGSLFMLTPHEDLHAQDYELVTIAGKKDVAMTDWPSVIPSSLAAQQLKIVRAEIRDVAVRDPGVPVYCIYSRSTAPSTESHYIYPSADFNESPKMSYVQGDGTLSRISLSFCRKWTSTILVKEFMDLDHMFVLRDPGVVKFVSGIVASLD